MVIDQHRAHQRILYEAFLRNTIEKDSTSQPLLFPLKIELSSSDMKIVNDLKEDLELAGFAFNEKNNNELEFSAVPLNVPESEVSIIIEQLVSDVVNDVPDANFSASDMLAKSLSKSLSIKSGQSLKPSEQEHIIDSLFACKEPTVSPFNKPTFITFGIEEFDKKFR